MVSGESVKDLFKLQILKVLTFVQLENLLYKQFTAMHSEGKPVTGPTKIEKA
jgi:hypothetical protein